MNAQLDLFSAEHRIADKPTVIELFAGAGGLALGFEKAGFQSVLLNEFDRFACQTLRHNRPHWQVVESSICEVDFSAYQGAVDVVSGGFPCQAFSYAGRGAGFNDTRGTLFFEFARAVQQIQPKILLAENVRGLVTHDEGRTLNTIKTVIDELGYDLIEHASAQSHSLSSATKARAIVFDRGTT